MFNIYSRNSGTFLRTCDSVLEARKFPESKCLVLRTVGGKLNASELRVVK